MAWLIAEYQGVALFSLKHGEATSTGGKSLLIPTPFAIRTALLDAAIRVQGISIVEKAFLAIQSLRLAVRPPDRVAISGLFTRILKPERVERGETRDRYFQKTIAFREYVQWSGPLSIAMSADEVDLEFAHSLLPHITYLGKRGSFVQLQGPATWAESLPDGFIPLEGHPAPVNLPASRPPQSFSLGIVQRLHDWGESLTWDGLNIYSEQKPDRRSFDIILPYRVVCAGRGFVVYERVSCST